MNPTPKKYLKVMHKDNDIDKDRTTTPLTKTILIFPPPLSPPFSDMKVEVYVPQSPSPSTPSAKGSAITLLSK